jgi:ribosomal protein L7/L12
MTNWSLLGGVAHFELDGREYTTGSGLLCWLCTVREEVDGKAKVVRAVRALLPLGLVQRKETVCPALPPVKTP